MKEMDSFGAFTKSPGRWEGATGQQTQFATQLSMSPQRGRAVGRRRGGLTVIVAADGLVEGSELGRAQGLVLVVADVVDLQRGAKRVLLAAGPVRRGATIRWTGCLADQEPASGATHNIQRDGTQQGVENLGGGLVGLVEITIEVLCINSWLWHGHRLWLRGCGGGHGDGVARISLAWPGRCGVRVATDAKLCTYVRTHVLIE